MSMPHFSCIGFEQYQKDMTAKWKHAQKEEEVHTQLLRKSSDPLQQDTTSIQNDCQLAQVSNRAQGSSMEHGTPSCNVMCTLFV